MQQFYMSHRTLRQLVWESAKREMVQAVKHIVHVGLQECVEDSDIHRLNQLKFAGCQIPQDGPDASQLLHTAIKNKSSGVVYWLLRNGVSPNLLTRTGESAIHHAARLGNTDIIRALLLFGVDASVTDEVKRTAVHVAAFLGHGDACFAILPVSLDPNTTDMFNRTPSDYAKEGGFSRLSTQLRTWKPAQAERITGATLLDAAESGDIEAIQMAIDEGVKLTATEVNGEAPLHRAVKKGQVNSVEILLKLGANIDIVDDFKQTPFHHAVIANNRDLMERLFAADADVNAQNSEGWTALHFAAYHGHSELLEPLYDCGADDRLRTNIGHAPLHLAAFMGALDSVKILLDVGSDSRGLTDDKGRTPLDIAYERKNFEVLDYLQQFKGRKKATLAERIRAGSMAALPGIE